MLREEGVAIKLIAPRLLLPVQPERLASALQGVKRVLVIEQTHGAQFYHYLRAHYDLVDEVSSMAIPGPLAIRPLEVYNRLKDWESGK